MVFAHNVLNIVRGCIEGLGVAVICFGVLRAVYQLIMLVIWRQHSENYIRLQFGNSVILGLEFMIGGDIIGSLVAPDYYNLGVLAIIVLIRSVLSYFLSLELHGLTPRQREEMK